MMPGSTRPGSPLRSARHKGTTRGCDDGVGLLMAEKRARGRCEKAAVPRSSDLTSSRSPRCSGMQTPATIARRLEAIRVLPWPTTRILRAHPTPEDVMAWLGSSDLAGVVVYMDPPYVGCTPYAVDCSRLQVLDLATRFRAAGALVIISEACRLDAELEGTWWTANLTRPGAKLEFLTMSAPAVSRPHEQLVLWAAK